MRFDVGNGGWNCSYDIDDASGALKTITCSRRRYQDPFTGAWIEPEPPGPGREELGWQAEAGEEDQDAGVFDD